MVIKLNIKSTKNFAATLFVGALLVLPVNSYAQSTCSMPPFASTAANTALPIIDTAIVTMKETIKQTITAQDAWIEEMIEMNLARLQSSVIEEIKTLGSNIIEEGLKPLTAQFLTAKMLANVQNAKAEDSKNMQIYDSKKQDEHYDAIIAYSPTTQDYRFDSKAIYLKLGDKYRRSTSSFLTKMLSDIGNNKEGYSTSGGEEALIDKRWKTFQKFCDPEDGKGNNGCTNPDASDENRVNIHTTPSKALFTNFTLDLENEGYLLEGLKELVFNISGFSNSGSIIPGGLDNPKGKERLVKGRGYLAQTDAVNSMMYSIIAERFPTEADGSVSAGEHPVASVRTYLGLTEPSEKPGLYEVRQSFVEELRTPEYYLDMIDNKNTIDRKEVYLRAYGLILLNNIIEKQEKISNAYAIETANMLQKMPILHDKMIEDKSTGQ